MKKITIPCDFGGSRSPFEVYIGNPKDGNHPLQHQSSWLSKERGGTIPSSFMETFSKLLQLAQESGVSFEDLCVHALQAAKADPKIAAQIQQAQQGGASGAQNPQTPPKNE